MKEEDPDTKEAPQPPPPLKHDTLLPYISSSTTIGRLVKHHIQEEGYCVLPGVLTKDECAIELSRLWDFVEATSPGVSRNEPNSWYPPPPSSSSSKPKPEATVDNVEDNNVPSLATTVTEEVTATDPWPHSGWGFLPDMCQSFQAGWLFGNLREMLADRVFEPLYDTRELHSSKEGFTFHRPTAPNVASNGATHPVLHQEKPRVCGKVQIYGQGEHFDQCAADTGLHCIQSSTALIDQKVGMDGCFRCWPGSHKEHHNITRDIWRGRSDWVPLTDEELAKLERAGLSPKLVPVNAGDVILWRSDLVHCGVRPCVPTTTFRAVSYTCMLPAALTSRSVLEGKLEEYLTMQTGDHRPNVKSRHFSRPKRGKKKKHGPVEQQQQNNRVDGENNVSSNVEVGGTTIVRGKYFADGPPILTIRCAQLYGLIPYDGCSPLDEATIIDSSGSVRLNENNDLR